MGAEQPTGDQTKPTKQTTTSTQVDYAPTAYDGSPYVEVNNNIPDFPKSDFTTTSFETYGKLDSLGRCTTAYANIGQDLMPTEKRGDISQINPPACTRCATTAWRGRACTTGATSSATS